MAKNNSLFTGFIVGSLISSAAALLLSSKSGSHIRNTIKDNTKQVRLELDRFVNQSKDTLSSIETSTKKNVLAVKEVSQDVKKSINDWQESVEPHKDNIKNEILNIEKSMKQLENNLKSAQK